MAQVEVKSEISGTVWKLETEPGQKVAAGDTVVVVESMKMEIPVLAETAGTILSFAVKGGDVVTEGQTVATMET